MNNDQLLEKINSLFKQAIELEKNKEYNKANEYALKSLELLAEVIKVSKEPQQTSLRKTFDLMVDFVQNLNKKTNHSNKSTNASVSKNVTKTTISLDEVIGHKTAKQEIKQNLIEPLEYPEQYQRFNIKVSKGLLMYGPPGTGKTTVAKAVANEIDAEFFHILCNEIMNMYVGESEKKLFEIFEKASQYKRSIIFFDEFDYLASDISQGGSDVSVRLVSQLKDLIDGFSSYDNIFILAATNYPEKIEFGIRRRLIPIYLGLPSQDEIVDLLKLKTKKLPIDSDVDFTFLSTKMVGYSGDDIEKVLSYASYEAFLRERDRKKTDPGFQAVVRKEDIICALQKVPLSVTKDDLIKFQEFNDKTKRK